MSERTLTTWTCDRCGITEDTRPGEQPSRWSSLTLVTPPKAEYDPRSSSHGNAHLCARCTSHARSFMARQPEQAVAS